MHVKLSPTLRNAVACIRNWSQMVFSGFIFHPISTEEVHPASPVFLLGSGNKKNQLGWSMNSTCSCLFSRLKWFLVAVLGICPLFAPPCSCPVPLASMVFGSPPAIILIAISDYLLMVCKSPLEMRNTHGLGLFST